MNSNFKHQSIQKHFGVIIENDKVITNITDSTENISKGSIFFARQGMSSHGSDYIKLALNRGAILIISSKAIINKKVHYVLISKIYSLDFFMTIMILNRRK